MMKIKFFRQITAVFFAVLLAIGSVTSAFAYGYEFSDYYALNDDADIFTDDEIESIVQKLNDVGKQTGWQIIVHTSLDGVSSSEMESYYNRVYDRESNYRDDSVMFVIDSASGNRIILTHGEAISYFSDSRMDEIKSNLKSYLNSDNMYGACVEFADTALEFYNEGIPSDESFYNVTESDSSQKDENKFIYVFTRWGWIFALVAIVAGGAFVGVNVGRYKFNGKSGTYNLKENSSVRLLDQQDVFLHKHTTYTTKSSSSSGSSSGGGSSGSSHGSSGSF